MAFIYQRSSTVAWDGESLPVFSSHTPKKYFLFSSHKMIFKNVDLVMIFLEMWKHELSQLFFIIYEPSLHEAWKYFLLTYLTTSASADTHTVNFHLLILLLLFFYFLVF